MLTTPKLLLVSALFAIVGLVVPPSALLSSPVAQAAAAGASAYRPISPIRVGDSRNGVGLGHFAGGETQQLSVVTPTVRAAAGLSDGDVVTAVVLNVTIVDASGPGFVTVWPLGGSRPNTSSVNSDYAGHTVANTVTTPVSSSGAVSLYSIGGSQIIVDAQGVFVAAESAAGGRLVSLTPVRALDTRSSGNPFTAGQTRVVDLRPYGVPASASAAVLNITLVSAVGAGFLTVWPGGAMPDASNLNANPGDIVANQVMVGMSNGQFSIYAYAGGHMIVDVAGYFTGDSDAASSDGLFVPVTPGRLFDTRSPSSPTSGATMSAGGVVTLPPSHVPGVPSSGVGAVALNLTLAHTESAGFATVWPSGGIPNVSSVNAHRAGQVVANHVVASLSSGSFKVFTHMGSDVIADVFGYWTSAGAAGPDGGGGGPSSSPPSSGPHSFLFPLPDGGHARWNSCQVVDYQLNPGSASAAQLAALAEAVTALEFATGLDLVQVGTTTGGLDRTPPPGARAVIALTTLAKSPILNGASGIGGGSYSTTGEVVSGFTLVSTDVSNPDAFTGLVLHELGHMVGLSHVGDPAQIMHPIVTTFHAYGSGDREGLWRVGAAQGCLGSGQALVADTAALEAPDEVFTVTCGAESMHPVFAGVEVLDAGENAHDVHDVDDVLAGEVCVRMPEPSR